MKTIVILLLFLLLSYGAFGQRVIDTVYKYEWVVDSMGEANDCSVRAHAEVFGLTYRQAHADLKRAGRHNRKGIDVLNYINYLNTNKTGYSIELSLAKDSTTNKSFIREVAETGSSYLMIAKDHIYAIQEYKGKWAIKGNHNERLTKPIAWLKIDRI